MCSSCDWGERVRGLDHSSAEGELGVRWHEWSAASSDCTRVHDSVQLENKVRLDGLQWGQDGGATAQERATKRATSCPD